MDSLTQIVLGAAVGEVALGRKIGNRALVWGAIGGTIPDLDVLANPFLDDIQALAFHRGITHSILFSVMAPLVFGYLVHRLYASKFHKTRLYKALVILLNTGLLAGITYGINYLLSHDGHPRWWFLFITVSLALFLLVRLYLYYARRDLEEPVTTFREWYWLFFLAFFTHIVLDSFTGYGTQVFQPISNYRLAFDTISVVDPLYTIPFLICIILVSAMKRGAGKRRLVNWIGIGISSGYMLFTIGNKLYVSRVFEKALAYREIPAFRFRTGPTIFNNVLWNCAAEDERNFYIGRYSILDTDPNLHYLNVIAKNHSLARAWDGNKNYQILDWFSDGYLAIYDQDTVKILADLRFGGMSDTVRDYRDLVFRFSVREENGTLLFSEYREMPEGGFKEMLLRLWRRARGR